jgi:hypothetical protein
MAERIGRVVLELTTEGGSFFKGNRRRQDEGEVPRRNNKSHPGRPRATRAIVQRPQHHFGSHQGYERRHRDGRCLTTDESGTSAREFGRV